MSKPKRTTDVEAALDLLATQVREEIMRIRDEGADAMKQGDYNTAKSVIEFAGKLESFAGDVDKLVGQWNTIAKQHDVEPETVKAIVGKAFFQRARKGTITSHFSKPWSNSTEAARPSRSSTRLGSSWKGDSNPRTSNY